MKLLKKTILKSWFVSVIGIDHFGRASVSHDPNFQLYFTVPFEGLPVEILA